MTRTLVRRQPAPWAPLTLAEDSDAGGPRRPQDKRGGRPSVRALSFNVSSRRMRAPAVQARPYPFACPDRIAQSRHMSKVIKNRNAVATGDISPDTGFVDQARRAPIISRDVAEARTEAQQIRERAQAEATEIHRQAELEAEQQKADGY